MQALWPSDLWDSQRLTVKYLVWIFILFPIKSYSLRCCVVESISVFAVFHHLESDSASHLVNLSENQSYLFLKKVVLVCGSNCCYSLTISWDPNQHFFAKLIEMDKGLFRFSVVSTTPRNVMVGASSVAGSVRGLNNKLSKNFASGKINQAPSRLPWTTEAKSRRAHVF